ncbi:MAG: MOSC domain-containing protein [Bosea sp. (in: a-proteobacteria)]
MSMFHGRVRGLYAALTAETASFQTVAKTTLALDSGGIPGDRHHGLSRAAGPREPWMPRGLMLRNDRQLSAVSMEDMAELARCLDLAAIDPALIGANILVEGIAGFSQIAPGSHLAIGGEWGGKGRFDGGAILKVEAYNRPCRGPGRKLALAHGRPELEYAFVKHAAKLRGLVLSVAYASPISPEEAVVVVPPITTG